MAHVSLPRSPLPMLRADLPTPESIAQAKRQMLREQREAEQQMNAVLIHCPECLTTLVADTQEEAWIKLDVHRQIRHPRGVAAWQPLE